MTDETEATGPDAEIDELRERIGALREEVAALRLKREPEPVEDAEVRTWDGTARVSELFGDKDELWLVHNMGARCPMCTLWADGFNGLRRHLEDRAAFVVGSPDDTEKQRAFAESRGWEFRMVSVPRPFLETLGFWYSEGDKDFALPGVSVFRRAGAGIERVSRDFFGPGDDYCPMFSFMSLLPTGQNEWWPKL